VYIYNMKDTKPYPFKYDDFVDEDSLKEYLILHFDNDKLDVRRTVKLPHSPKYEVKYTEVEILEVISIVDNKLESICKLRPDMWNIENIRDILIDVERYFK
jgi:hypothetical protein